MRFPVLVALALAPLSAQPPTTRTDATNWLNRGIESYRQAQFEEAAGDFEKAAQLDPTNPNAYLYSGMAWSMLYVPGSDFPDNIAYFEHARDAFKRALGIVPNYPPGLLSLAKLLFQQAQGTKDPDDRLGLLNEAQGYFEKLVQLDSRQKEGWYSLGAIDWMKGHPQVVAARGRLGMKPDDPGPIPDPQARQKLKAAVQPLIDAGLANLDKALRIDPFYDQAADYMGRLIRDRADLRDTAAEYKQDIAESESWEQKSIEAQHSKPPKPGR